MEHLLGSCVAFSIVMAAMAYGLLLMIGALFGGGPKLANQYALWLVKLPFKLATMVWKKIFKKKPPQRGRRRR